MVRPKDQRCRSVPKVEFPTLGACGWNIAILATSSLRDEFMTAENEIYISNHLRSPWGRFTPVDLKNDVDDLDAHLTLNHVQNLYTLDIRLATARAGLWLAWCWYLLLLWWWLSRCWAPPCAVPLIRNQKGRVALLGWLPLDRKPILHLYIWHQIESWDQAKAAPFFNPAIFVADSRFTLCLNETSIFSISIRPSFQALGTWTIELFL